MTLLPCFPAPSPIICLDIPHLKMPPPPGVILPSSEIQVPNHGCYALWAPSHHPLFTQVTWSCKRLSHTVRSPSFPIPHFPTLYSPPLHCSQNEACHHVLILPTPSAPHMVGCWNRTLLQTCKRLPSIKPSMPLFLTADSFFVLEAGQRVL